MSRLSAKPMLRMAASATALAAVVGITLIASSPAKADHEFSDGPRVAFSGGLFFGLPFFAPPLPAPVPVYVQHQVVYPRPHYYGHRHWRGHHYRGHGHRHHDRDWDRGGHGGGYWRSGDRY